MLKKQDFSKPKYFFLIALACLLAGCWITTYEIVGNSRSVTYGGVVGDKDLSEAYKQAAIHCSRFSRVAELSNTDSEDNIATFRCVE
ncbi:MAG: hypothetical protein CMF54_06925 [Legionellales bacterium]|nr:hypothetical protein [Legionellales bacterium]